MSYSCDRLLLHTWVISLSLHQGTASKCVLCGAGVLQHEEDSLKFHVQVECSEVKWESLS